MFIVGCRVKTIFPFPKRNSQGGVYTTNVPLKFKISAEGKSRDLEILSHLQGGRNCTCLILLEIIINDVN